MYLKYIKVGQSLFADSRHAYPMSTSARCPKSQEGTRESLKGNIALTIHVLF